MGSSFWQAAKAGGANPMMGIDGIKGVLADMSTLGVWDTFAVKVQTLKTAIEVSGRFLPGHMRAVSSAVKDLAL